MCPTNDAWDPTVRIVEVQQRSPVCLAKSDEDPEQQLIVDAFSSQSTDAGIRQTKSGSGPINVTLFTPPTMGGYEALNFQAQAELL